MLSKRNKFELESESCQTRSWVVKQFKGQEKQKRFADASAWISLKLLFLSDPISIVTHSEKKEFGLF